MENLLFAFNIILTVLFTIAITGFYVLYKKNKHNKYMYLSLLFVLLVIENSIIYLSEFSGNFEILYETSEILYILMYSLFIGIVILSRLISSEVFHDKITAREFKFNLVLLIMTIGIYFVTEFEVAELIIYSYFYLALLYICVRTFIHIKNASLDYSKSMIKLSMIFTMLVSIVCLCGVIESISYYKSYGEVISNTSPALSLEYRNLAFDFIKLISAVLGIIYLKFSFDHIFKDITASGASTDFLREATLEISTESKLNQFYTNNSITTRQQEIIKLIVEGDSNKEISGKLFITEGTVKTHIYNIFKKVDVSSRTQLLNKVLND